MEVCGSTVEVLWECCGSYVGVLCEYCGSAVGVLWEFCVSVVGVMWEYRSGCQNETHLCGSEQGVSAYRRVPHERTYLIGE